MDVEISLRAILWGLAIIVGCGALLFIGRVFRACSRGRARRAALEQILEHEEPPHPPH